MPRVIKKVPRKEEQVVCEHCGYTIGYFKSDVKTRSYSYYGGGSNVDAYIVCPNDECGNRIILSSS